ncbi:MAG: hypoxanthine phosphoribosyltransferase [Candidatus Eisenbacteria bacterium]|uniref:Hypoxanthine phosphoribosyltransferase n=1 Tax=Eiseniibacteriota bacterium TaxID=2212470 RepID=A0A937XAA5_UNCEI|nr:hypoxanthine phosphoribosyltransferase [Candidatus Eisenbacteria bacterium]
MIDAIRQCRRGDEVRLADGTCRILFTAEEIGARIAELGRELARDYQGRVPVLIGMLRGGFVFQCDLARAAGIPLELDYLSVSRFDPRERGRTAVKVLHDLRSDVRGRHVIVLEGIRTNSTKMEYVRTFLELREPASLAFGALIRHGDARNHSVGLQYKGFDAGNEFVIGCGLDYLERYRNLPVIATFAPSAPPGKDSHA